MLSNVVFCTCVTKLTGVTAHRISLSFVESALTSMCFARWRGRFVAVYLDTGKRYGLQQAKDYDARMDVCGNRRR